MDDVQPTGDVDVVLVLQVPVYARGGSVVFAVGAHQGAVYRENIDRTGLRQVDDLHELLQSFHLITTVRVIRIGYNVNLAQRILSYTDVYGRQPPCRC